MWTRPQIKDFKEKIRQDVDSVITVGRGEVVTVRVPTHEEGSYLFWEFATDHYDIGFGVFFEWTDSTNASVSVHVSESSDEDEDEDGEGAELISYPHCMWCYFHLYIHNLCKIITLGLHFTKILEYLIFPVTVVEMICWVMIKQKHSSQK